MSIAVICLRRLFILGYQAQLRSLDGGQTNQTSNCREYSDLLDLNLRHRTSWRYASIMRVQALAFDVVGTLMDWRFAITEALVASPVAADAGEFADAWRKRSFAAQAEVNAGSRPWANLDALNLATLDDLLAERDADLPLEQRHRLVQAWHRLPPWPDVAAGLEALQSHCVTAALSNGHLAMVVNLARHADLRFDCLLTADMALLYKPAPELYLTAARLLDVQPAELMLVAAHPADLRGARRAGLKTAFVDRPLRAWSRRCRPPRSRRRRVRNGPVRAGRAALVSPVVNVRRPRTATTPQVAARASLRRTGSRATASARRAARPDARSGDRSEGQPIPRPGRRRQR